MTGGVDDIEGGEDVVGTSEGSLSWLECFGKGAELVLCGCGEYGCSADVEIIFSMKAKLNLGI